MQRRKPRSHKSKLHVKYDDNRGLESDVTEFAPDASQFSLGLPVPLSKFKLPKIPKIKLPPMPGLPEKQREELERIQERLDKEIPGNRGSE